MLESGTENSLLTKGQAAPSTESGKPRLIKDKYIIGRSRESIKLYLSNYPAAFAVYPKIPTVPVLCKIAEVIGEILLVIASKRISEFIPTVA